MAGSVTGAVVSMAVDLQSGYIRITSTDMLVFFNVRNATPTSGAIIVGANVAFDFAHKSILNSTVIRVDIHGNPSYASVDEGPAGIGQAINISVV